MAQICTTIEQSNSGATNMGAIKGIRRMKSIKENAEEYQETALKEKGAILRVDVRNAFEAGANYVLEEIEKILSKVNEYKDGSDHTILYLDIEFLVKQLKK